MIPRISDNAHWVKKLPDKIIYLREVNNVLRPPQCEYVIFSPKNSEYGGVLKCHKSTLPYLDTDYKGSTLAIDFIRTSKRGKGYGKALLDFAKILSKQTGCEGQMILKAVGTFSPLSVPHLFYRKNGFTTLDKKTDKKMDKFIKKNQRATQKDFSDMFMFYPEPEKNLVEKIEAKIEKYKLIFDEVFRRIFM